jgi:hypothetical protein
MTKWSLIYLHSICDNWGRFQGGNSATRDIAVLDNIQFSNNHVQTNASFISAGWVSAGFIAQQLGKEGTRGEILFDDACLHLIALNYLLHNMGFFAGTQDGAFNLKNSLETLLSTWQDDDREIHEATPPDYIPVDHYFRILEATAHLGTYWHMQQENQLSTSPQIGLVRGLSLIYPSLWLLTIQWNGRNDLVHFDRQDFSNLEIAEITFRDSDPQNAVLLPYPPRLPLSSRSTPISG